MKPIKTHTFNGRKHHIMMAELDGFCEQYKISNDDRTLAILCDPATQNGLITIIHESLHACNWAKKEDVVDQVSKDIGRFLWRLGWRKVE